MKKTNKMVADKIALFKTKEDVLLAAARGDVTITSEVLENSDFISANQNDLLGFMAESGSDYKIIEVKAVKDDPQAFFSLAFGGGFDSGAGHN